MLLDSGASANLMHPALASSLGVKLSTMPSSLNVILADGSRRECSQIADKLELRIRDTKTGDTADTTLQFYVADMEGSQHDIILGMPFLKQENPTIDWLRRTIGLRATDGHATDIHAVSATIKKLCAAGCAAAHRRRVRRARRGRAHEWCVISMHASV